MYKIIFLFYLSCISLVLAYPLLKPGVSWQLRAWCGPDEKCHNQDVNGFLMVDVDLFDTSKAIISELAKNHIVICYFSAGSFESWRPDAKSFSNAVKGLKMSGWNEIWLDIRNLEGLKVIMGKRIALAKEKGCHGIEPDNVDCWSNKCVSGVAANNKIMFNAQIIYNKWLAQEAHKNDLSIGLKNDLGQIQNLINDFDWAINEQCFSYNECDSLKPFIQNQKAVFNVEYSGDPKNFCLKSKGLKFMSKYDEKGLWIDC